MGQSVVSNTGNMAIVQNDLTKIFVWNNRYENGTFEYTNSTYDDVTIQKGSVIGRVLADQTLVLLESGASDGSQYPVGVLAEDIVVEAGESYSATASICVAGDVDESKLNFQGSDDLDTEVSGRSLRDRLASDTVGIKLVGGDQLTAQDNE